MVLLNLLKDKPGVELVVAHFDHGIRKDSDKDTELVKNVAKKHSLKFEAKKGKLGPKASEETARKARYEFLESVRQKYRAEMIITAHHQDDLIETALINLIRGTKRKGLSAITANPKVIRPLLQIPKSQILKYARSHHLIWHEDITNQDRKYLRNYLRLVIIPKIPPQQKKKLISNLDKVAKLNKIIDEKIATLSQQVISRQGINRSQIISLPIEVGEELIAYWLRQQGLAIDKKTVRRLTMFIKTGLAGSSTAVKSTKKLVLDKSYAHLI